MNKRQIISNAKKEDEEKVGFSLKIPKSLKEQLQSLAETESVSMNALIVATLESLINDDCGKELKQAKQLLLEYRGFLTDKQKPFKNRDFVNEEEQDYYFGLQNTIDSIDKILGV